ncbi:hypothetical protein Kpol_1061p11 [Vanderwaltozyma polyspora DSM 70294]|uniref:Zn(2)-C6 fungal-type domain-containing protein n=1 Tax=Vanderwaltozyma polyspora (strain ATCC 22028 / DSM 70294 / BCRC 21397 / CBS 2163 / NBRC 10782 / NRRL Y-8283 / UCD 57-17) TaxID=436907 RepID=A7TJD9_VANPO|nr:uncharacterized protein Kpol_1061p11 [Vanderwaltozyma polyspora DSM 70294]EDO17589.1 hypothetical protein Kpol_1061p11 [Vanderwaltozyma polyspora DSM 70294]
MFETEETRSNDSRSSSANSEKKDVNASSIYSSNSSISSADKLASNLFPEQGSAADTPNYGNLDLESVSSNIRYVSGPSTNASSPNDYIAPSLKPKTSVTSTIKDSKGNVVKRKYSRNGCAECKRRRMKCDETKPTCWQCSRLNRECVYVLNPKNKKRNGKSTENIVEEHCSSTVVTPSKIELRNTYTDIQKNVLNVNGTVKQGIQDAFGNHSITSEVSGYDASLLIQNLNDIVNMKLHDSFQLNEDLKDLGSFDLELPELISKEETLNSVPISFNSNSIITFNTDLSSLKLGDIHEKYLKLFYYDCMDSIAPFFQDQGNPLRDILLSFAKGESYLLSAILAVGASIEHRKTEDLEDEKNYCQYLSHCLRCLDEQFQNESNVINKIEPIILTVIMLAWDCIYTMNSQWRSHLKGIIDLFKKIHEGNSSKVLNVAKCWFKIMETFASISTNFGGSLTSDCDIDLIFNPYDYQYVDSLKYLDIMTPLNEFNLLRGHKEDFDIVIKEVMKSLNKLQRINKSKNENGKIIAGELSNLPLSFQRTIVSPGTMVEEEPGESLSYFATQKILVEIDRQLDYEFINKSGIIPLDNQSHPSKSQIKDNAIDLVKLRNGEEIAISWYDISHQTQVLSYLMIVLLKLLNIRKTSPIIQEVVKRITSFFKFLDSDEPPKNRRTCYSNFAILIAGLNANDEETKDVIRNYYHLNSSTFSRLSEHNLHRLEEVWAGNSNAAEQDILTW